MSRMIHTKISQSEKLASLSAPSQLLFLMLIPHFSNFGKMHGGAGFIKDVVCPLIETLPQKVIENCLNEISQKTNVKRYRVKGIFYLQSLSWESHQVLRKDRMGADHLPDCGGGLVDNLSTTCPHEVKVSRSRSEVEDKVPPADIVEIVYYLNLKAGTKYRASSKSTISFLTARLKNYSLADCKKVIDTKCLQWLGTGDEMYLRPETLFNETKFENYINQKATASKIDKAGQSVIDDKEQVERVLAKHKRQKQIGGANDF